MRFCLYTGNPSIKANCCYCSIPAIGALIPCFVWLLHDNETRAAFAVWLNTTLMTVAPQHCNAVTPPCVPAPNDLLDNVTLLLLHHLLRYHNVVIGLLSIKWAKCLLCVIFICTFVVLWLQNAITAGRMTTSVLVFLFVVCVWFFVRYYVSSPLPDHHTKIKLTCYLWISVSITKSAQIAKKFIVFNAFICKQQHKMLAAQVLNVK